MLQISVLWINHRMAFAAHANDYVLGQKKRFERVCLAKTQQAR